MKAIAFNKMQKGMLLKWLCEMLIVVVVDNEVTCAISEWTNEIIIICLSYFLRFHCHAVIFEKHVGAAEWKVCPGSNGDARVAC